MLLKTILASALTHSLRISPLPHPRPPNSPHTHAHTHTHTHTHLVALVGLIPSASHDTKSATTAPTQGPEQVWMRARRRLHQCTVRSDHFQANDVVMCPHLKTCCRSVAPVPNEVNSNLKEHNSNPKHSAIAHQSWPVFLMESRNLFFSANRTAA